MIASHQTNILPYTQVFIKLLKGPVEYLERNTWDQLLQYQNELSLFLLKMGLSLIVEKDDGYAYVEQVKIDDEDTTIGWIRRTPLGYDESVLLVLLREMMADFEVGEATSRELIKKRREIKEQVELFFKEDASRVKFIKELDKLIDKVEELGFLDKVEHHDLADEQKFRIKKIIKAKVNHEVLEHFKQQLTEHAAKCIQHGQ